MSFLSPLFLLGLPLLSVPVVIHLLSRRQQKRISWGAMRFLVQAATRKRRIWRLTDLLLLLLRTAALLFFVLALARPLLPATWLGGSVPREVILVIDHSLSLDRRSAGTSLFQLQLQKAGTLLDQLNPNDTIRVLLAGESPHWLSVDPLPATTTTLRKLQEELSALQPSLGSADLVACLREAADLEASPEKSARVIHLITDGQRFGWRLDEELLWTALATRIQESPIPTAVNVQLLQSGGSDHNLSLNAVDTPRPFATTGQALTLTASVQNHSTLPSPPTLLSWRVEDQSIGVTTVPELPPGAITTLTTTHSFETAGTFDVVCLLDSNDPLPADNQARVFIEVFERLPILVVEDAAPPLETDTPFILAALGAGQNGESQAAWRSVFEPTVISTSDLAITDLTQFRCAILANTPTLPPAAVEKLEAYVRNGGGVWLALGARTDQVFFNDQLFRGGLGLAPLKLSSPVGDQDNHETFIPLRATSDAHPATSLLADFQRLDLDRVRVYRRHQFDPFSGKDVSILLQTPGGDPVAVERKLGRGRVLVQSFPLGLSWSTLPLCQVYVAMLHEWFWYLTEPNLTHRNLAVGETLTEPAVNPETGARLVLPDGRAVTLSPGRDANPTRYRYSETRLPGLYSLTRDDGSDPAAPSRFQVRRDPRESDLTAISDTDHQHFANAKWLAFSGGLGSLDAVGEIKIPKHPLEGWLLIGLAFVLLGELALAGWTTRQRRLKASPVTM